MTFGERGTGDGLSFLRLVAPIELVFHQFYFVPPRMVIGFCPRGLLSSIFLFRRRIARQLQAKGEDLLGDIGMRLKGAQAKDKTDKTDKTMAEACPVAHAVA